MDTFFYSRLSLVNSSSICSQQSVSSWNAAHDFIGLSMFCLKLTCTLSSAFHLLKSSGYLKSITGHMQQLYFLISAIAKLGN